MRYCFNIGLEVYTYVLLKDEVFGGFGDWFPAWLQNLLGNTVTFTALYEKIKEAHDTKNLPDALFWYGRLTFIIFDFHPISGGETDIDFESDTAQPWWVDSNTENLAHDFSVPTRRSSLNAALREEHHPRVEGWFDEAYGFLAGFLNITFGDKAPNSSICISNVTRVVEVSLDFGNHIVVISNDSWLEASYDFQQIFETIHPIFYSCYRSAFEYYEAALDYGVTFTDWRNLVYNLIHNIGFLYDAIYFLVIHHMAYAKDEIKEATVEEQANWFYKLGIYYGTLIYRIFYTELDVGDGDFDPLAEIIGVIPGWMEDLKAL